MSTGYLTRPAGGVGDRAVWRLRPRVLDGLLGVLAAVALIGLLALMLPLSDGDYSVLQPGADNAGPPIEALVHGHLSALPRLQTVMGLTSTLWRVPAVAVVTAFDGTSHLGYLVGLAACLVPVVGFVAWLALREATPRQRYRALIAAMVMIVGPASTRAAIAGHPEELLTIGLATAAVLLARADRRTWAAVAAGLSIGSKEWAIVALPVVLVAAPAGRRRLLALALAIAAAMTLPLPLIDPAAFHRADLEIGPLRTISTLSLWWPERLVHPLLPFGMKRTAAFAAALTVVAGITLGVGNQLRQRAHPRPPAVDPLALLVLACTLRCLCDPMDSDYYLVAVTVPLAIWEVGSLRRMPVASLLVWTALGVCYGEWGAFSAAPSLLPGAVAVPVFLACALVLAGYLTLRTFVPSAPAALPASDPLQPAPPSSPASACAPTLPPLSTTPTR